MEGTSGSGDRKKNRFLRVLGIALICIVALVLIAVGAVYAVFMHYYNMTNYVKDDDVSTIAAADAETYSVEGYDDDDDDEYYIVQDVTNEDGEVIGQTRVAVNYDDLTEDEKESADAQVEVELSQAAVEQQEALDMVASGQLYLPEEKTTVVVTREELYEEYEVETDDSGTIVSVVKDGVEYEVITISDDGDEITLVKKTDESDDKSDIVTVDTSSKNDVYNLLFVGSDAGGRSDSMILISINNTDKEINMISFMRDLYADIPGYGVLKLNKAYQYGGGPLLIQTLEENYGITMDSYAAVDFYSMIDIVNAIGGVTIDISADEVEVANMYIRNMCNSFGLNASDYYINGSGSLLLNGMQTVAYCRIRYVGRSDYQRTQRQRTVLVTMFNTLKGQSVSQINSFLNTALPEVTHNIPSTTLASLLMNATSYLGYSINQYRIPIDGYFYYSGEILVPDFTYTISELNSIIYY